MESAPPKPREAAPGPGRSEGRTRLSPRAWRRGDIRIFSSASDAPRARRPTDVVLLALSTLVVVFLAFPAPGPTAIDNAITALVQSLPGLFGWFWEVSYDLLIGWGVILLLITLLARGRKRLLLEELFAAALALGFAVIAGKLAGTDPSLSLKALGTSGAPPVYLATRLALATAVIVMASPHLSSPMRDVGRWVIGIGAFAGIALGTTLPIGMTAGFAIGIGSAAIVHLLLGSPAGRLTLDQVAAALADLGIEAEDLQHAPLEPRGVALATAGDAGGRRLLVKIYGRDAWDGQLLATTWASLWQRGETPRFGSGRLQQVEHEAFVTLFAERGGVAVLPVVAAGLAAERDALLVTEITGRGFDTLAPGEVGDDLLRGMWRLGAGLHDLGVAHGRIDGARLVVRPDGSPALGDFGEARIAAPEAALMADRAQFLVTTALSVGDERAVSAAADSLGSDGVAEVLPYLQPAILDRATRHAVGRADWSLDGLRKLAASTAGVDVPELEKVRRVTWASVAVTALIGFVVYAMIAAVSQVGLQTLVNDFRNADWWWLAGALAASPAIQLAQAVSTMGASARPVRFGPVAMLQYAIQFIALAVPSSAARVALEVRFFECNGADAGAAISIGAIDSVCGFVVQMVLILVITLSGLVNLDLSSTSSSSSSSSSSSGSSSGSHPIVILLAVALVLAGIVALAVPRYRAMVAEAIPRYRASLRAQASASAAALRVLRSPSKLTMIFSGNLVAQLLQAIVLGLCLHAFGHRAPFAGLILVNTFVSLFAGFMPVPGGMGVAEAGYTAGLVALGIPNAAAMSTAIAFRLVTFYLPPIWGSLATRWLRRHSYV